ncbi:hypothetical protein DRQ07_00160 [candidate division KSB1 bacterium]|nr:MAG: hypothetical protein DRQ07_00160 [candidate division KSB1 bacterium]
MKLKLTKNYYYVLILCLTAVPALLFPQNSEIRQSARAGQFYPADPEQLSTTVKKFLDSSEIFNINGKINGLLVPHAGYEFSGRVAASGYRQVEGNDYDLVFIIGTCHYKAIKGAALADWDAFETPLGLVKLDKKLINDIAEKSDLINIDREAHLYEHSVEVQLPFIQTILPGIPIVPMVMGRSSYGEIKNIVKTIAKATKGEKVLFIASSDMSHYPDYRSAYEVDLKTLDQIKKYDPKGVLRLNNEIMRKGIKNLDCTLCGLDAVVTVMMLTKLSGADKVFILPYMNSGDLTGERRRVVGYGSAVFYHGIKSKQEDKPESNEKIGGRIMGEDISFSLDEKKKLFKIARKSILAALRRESIPHFDVKENNLKLKRGVFVTLTNNGELRGCIGHFGQDTELWEIVSQMAVAAATQDYRFSYNPVTAEEMKNIDIKISILSPLRKIDSIDEIEIGKHGIWIKKGMRGGTYLPEVATEMGWTKEEFLEHCTVEKAGLESGAWKKDAEIYIYSSQILSEKEIKN